MGKANNPIMLPFVGIADSRSLNAALAAKEKINADGSITARDTTSQCRSRSKGKNQDRQREEAPRSRSQCRSRSKGKNQIHGRHYGNPVRESQCRSRSKGKNQLDGVARTFDRMSQCRSRSKGKNHLYQFI